MHACDCGQPHAANCDFGFGAIPQQRLARFRRRAAADHLGLTLQHRSNRGCGAADRTHAALSIPIIEIRAAYVSAAGY